MQKNNKETGFNFYRIKTEWTRECENGELGKVKTEELVLATSYTDAETIALEIAEDQNRGRFGKFVYEIIKTKITDVKLNEILSQDDTLPNVMCNFFEDTDNSGEGLYAVKVVVITLDEKTGKEKSSTETIYMPATSNADATTRVGAYMGLSDCVVRDTKFDKAEAIYLPKNIYKQMIEDSASA